MDRVYHVDDYKSMAIDLLCLASNLKVIYAISNFGSIDEVKALVRAAAILTRIGNTIPSEPLVIDDTPFSKVVNSKH